MYQKFLADIHKVVLLFFNESAVIYLKTLLFRVLINLSATADFSSLYVKYFFVTLNKLHVEYTTF